MCLFEKPYYTWGYYYGVAAGVGRNSANIGCGGYYGHRMADDNVIGIVMSNTYPCQAPFGGADRLIGTNPIIMGCPTTNPNRPIVIDISTSGVAIGKVQAYPSCPARLRPA